MPHVEVRTFIQASPERCFDLARDMRVHETTTASSDERVVSGPASGMLELGDEVTFEAVHFGLRQRLTSKIVGYDRPNEFTDQMQKGAFKSMSHIHRFETRNGGTEMVDILDFEAPGWIFGKLAGHLLLVGYMRRFLQKRGIELKRIAESI